MVATLVVAGAVVAGLGLIGGAETAQKTALVLIATRRDAPVSATLDGAIRTVLDDGLAGRLDYYTEYLDVTRFPDPDYQLALRDFLRRKYAHLNVDVVVATTDDTVNFVNTHRNEVFPGAAVVFNAFSARSGPKSTGVLTPYDLKSTIDVALQLHPDLQHVFVVSGVSADDRLFADLARAQFRTFEGRLDFTYSSGLAMPDLIRRVAALPPGTIIFFLTFFEDVDGARFIPFEAFARLRPVANVPIYHWTDIGMGHGMVGGSVLNIELMARALAGVALRVLNGESPESIPVRHIDASTPQFDWRQLQRWGIAESRLPEGSLVRFREPSVWDRYKYQIVGATSVLVLQTGLIAGLLVQRARRRRVENDLRASEAALRTSTEMNRDVAGRLITAQEDERRRISRDLHDDFNQRLAFLSVEMELLAQDESDIDVGTRSGRIAAQLRILSSDLHKLSHQLHPAKVEQLGLVTSAQSWCAEVAKQSGLHIEFCAREVPPDLPPAISLCLYRIIQESLRNVVRHSQSSTAQVELAGGAEGLRLAITDQGQGFDVDQAMRAGGLGLVSMQERIRINHGAVAVFSSPGRGTRVEATLPRL